MKQQQDKLKAISSTLAKLAKQVKTIEKQLAKAAPKKKAAAKKKASPKKKAGTKKKAAKKRK